MKAWENLIILLVVLGFLTLLSYFLNRSYIAIKRDDMRELGVYKTWLALGIPSALITLAGFIMFIIDDKITTMTDVGMGLFFIGAVSWACTLQSDSDKSLILRSPPMEYSALTLTSIGMMLLAAGTSGVTQILFGISCCYLIFVDNIWYVHKLYDKKALWYTLFGHLSTMVVIIAIQTNTKDYKVPVVLRFAEWNMTEGDTPVLTDDYREYFSLNTNYMVYMFAIIYSVDMYFSAASLVSDIDYYKDQINAVYGNNAIRMCDYAISTPLMIISLLSLFQSKLEIVTITFVFGYLVNLMMNGYYIDCNDITLTERIFTFIVSGATFLIVTMCIATYIWYANEAPVVARFFMVFLLVLYWTFPIVTTIKLFFKQNDWRYEKLYVSLGCISKLPLVAITLSGLSAASGSEQTIAFTTSIFIISGILGTIFIRYG